MSELPPDTRPGEIGRAEARRIAAEIAPLIDDDRSFREHVVRTLAVWDERWQRMDEHIEKDESRFAAVTQSIGGNDNKIHWLIGVGVGVVGVVGVIGLWLTLRGMP